MEEGRIKSKAKQLNLDVEGLENLDHLGDEVKTEGKAYLLTAEQIFQIMLAILSLKAIRTMPIFKARVFCISNKQIIITFLEEYAKMQKGKNEATGTNE